MKKLTAIAIILLSLATSTAALAVDLATARSQKAVTEQPDGYLKAVSNDTEIKKLVSEVNEGRKAEYERISKENGQPVDLVAKLAAQQLMEKYK